MAKINFLEKSPGPLRRAATAMASYLAGAVGATVQRLPTGEAGDEFARLGDTVALGGGRGSIAAVPAAFAAVGLISDTLAALPRVVRVGDEDADFHPVAALLANPSRDFDPWIAWELMLRPYVARGNGFAHIVRARRDRRPMELVPAWCSHAHRDSTRGARYWLTFFDGSRADDVAAADVLTFHNQGYDGLWSPSPIEYAARRTLTLMTEVATRQLSTLRHGLSAGSAIETHTDLAALSPDQYKALQGVIEESYSGARNAGKTPVLPPGAKVQNVTSLSASDLQLVELLKWGVEDVARAFGLSPIRIGHYHAGFRARTFEQQSADYERYPIHPHSLRLAAQMTTKLLGRADRRAEIVIPTEMLRQGSLTERIAAAGQAVANYGLWTINEGRELSGKPPRADGDRLMSPRGAPDQNAVAGVGADADADVD